MPFTMIATLALALLQQPKDSNSFTPAARGRLIESILAKFEERYVYPEVAEAPAFEIRERAAKHRYDSLESPSAFAATLTAEMRELTDDLHIVVQYSSEPLPKRAEDREPTAQEIEALRVEAAFDNFGFARVERLPGNLGYLDLRRFEHPGLAAATAHTAMAFLADTDALIIDLRQNHGGTPEMVQLLCSYLFGPEPVLINSIYNRPRDETREFWTLKELPGRRFVGKDVYVLISHETGSAAEEFAYDVQCLKRATLVGETTAGAAHPGERVRLDEHFTVFVPDGRPINPVTKTDWENVGVRPDVPCTDGSALLRTQALALERLAAGDIDTRRKNEREQALVFVRAALDQLARDAQR